jgi:hypothetical protein
MEIKASHSPHQVTITTITTWDLRKVVKQLRGRTKYGKTQIVEMLRGFMRYGQQPLFAGL